MLTRHDHHTALCATPGCPCEELAEERAYRSAEPASEWDMDLWDGRFEDRYVWREAS